MSQQLVDEIEKGVTPFIQDNLEQWITDTVLKRILSYARAANMPQSFIDHIHIEIVDGQYAIVNDWKNSEGKPLSIFFEHGTVDHWVAPRTGGFVTGGVLAWPAAPGKHGSAIYYQSGVAPGTMLFSKGHYVTGLPKLEPMTKGLAKGIQQLKRKMKKEIKQKFTLEDEDHKVRVRI